MKLESAFKEALSTVSAVGEVSKTISVKISPSESESHMIDACLKLALVREGSPTPPSPAPLLPVFDFSKIGDCKLDGRAIIGVQGVDGRADKIQELVKSIVRQSNGAVHPDGITRDSPGERSVDVVVNFDGEGVVCKPLAEEVRRFFEAQPPGKHPFDVEVARGNPGARPRITILVPCENPGCRKPGGRPRAQ